MKKICLLFVSIVSLSLVNPVLAQSESEHSFKQTITLLETLTKTAEKEEMTDYSYISSLIKLVDGGITDIEETEEDEAEQVKWMVKLEKEALDRIKNTITSVNKIEVKTSDFDEGDVSSEFKNALTKAENYATMMHMSKIGVYNQLISEYGEGFPADAAQYAVDNLDIDWNANALEKAKSYYEMMAMSKDGVYDQLVSEYGEQFTPEQAQYAIDNLE